MRSRAFALTFDQLAALICNRVDDVPPDATVSRVEKIQSTQAVLSVIMSHPDFPEMNDMCVLIHEEVPEDRC